MWLQTYKYQHNLNYPRYKVNRLYIVQCSIFCFWLKSYWKKAHYYSNDAISSITVQGQVESPMHLQIMAASTRDFAYNSYQKKNQKTFDLIIIISIDYGVFQRLHWNIVLFIWWDQIMTKAHTQSIWSQCQTKPSKLLVIKIPHWESHVAQI